jgi:hypothetical protein
LVVVRIALGVIQVPCNVAEAMESKLSVDQTWQSLSLFVCRHYCVFVASVQLQERNRSIALSIDRWQAESRSENEKLHGDDFNNVSTITCRKSLELMSIPRCADSAGFHGIGVIAI